MESNVEEHHRRIVRNQLWHLSMSLLKLHGAIIALIEQIDLWGHELDVTDIEHLYERFGWVADDWQRLLSLEPWRTIDEGPLDEAELGE